MCVISGCCWRGAWGWDWLLAGLSAVAVAVAFGSFGHAISARPATQQLYDCPLPSLPICPSVIRDWKTWDGFGKYKMEKESVVVLENVVVVFCKRCQQTIEVGEGSAVAFMEIFKTNTYLPTIIF